VYDAVLRFVERTPFHGEVVVRTTRGNHQVIPLPEL